MNKICTECIYHRIPNFEQFLTKRIHSGVKHALLPSVIFSKANALFQTGSSFQQQNHSLHAMRSTTLFTALALAAVTPLTFADNCNTGLLYCGYNLLKKGMRLATCPQLM